MYPKLGEHCSHDYRIVKPVLMFIFHTPPPPLVTIIVHIIPSEESYMEYHGINVLLWRISNNIRVADRFRFSNRSSMPNGEIPNGKIQANRLSRCTVSIDCHFERTSNSKKPVEQTEQRRI